MSSSLRTCLLVKLMMGLVAAVACAQTLPAALPDLSPSTRPRREAILPEGFIRAQIEGRMFFLEPADEAWVRAALDSLVPATMPATMPIDLLERLEARQQQITREIQEDLAMTDSKPIDDYLNQKLKVFLRQMDEYRPPIIYLVTSRQRLIDIMKDGWTDPRFYFNRAANEVAYSTRMNLALDERDDELVALIYDPAQSPQQRQERLVVELRATESGILDAVARETLAMTTVGFVELISSQALSSLGLQPDQEWLAVGIAGVLSAEYVAELSGISATQLLDGLTQENRANPIRPATIDLLRPLKLSELRPQMVAAYLDAYRRKAMQVVRVLRVQGGENAIAKVLHAVRQAPPTDGPGLVKLIQRITAVDLSRELQPR